MRKRDEFINLLSDLLAPLGDVAIKPMFSGYGIYSGAQMFALAIDSKLYFKVDVITAPRFDAERCVPFSYTAKNKVVVLSYRQAPDRLYDEPDEMLNWAREALASAVRAQALRPIKRRRTSKRT